MWSPSFQGETNTSVPDRHRLRVRTASARSTVRLGEGPGGASLGEGGNGKDRESGGAGGRGVGRWGRPG